MDQLKFVVLDEEREVDRLLHGHPQPAALERGE